MEKTYAPAAPGSKEEKIEAFIKGLLEHMGSDAVPHAYLGENDTYQVDLVGEDLGFLIGRRGETLDAIQHLTNYAINRDSSKRARINVDAENYPPQAGGEPEAARPEGGRQGGQVPAGASP